MRETERLSGIDSIDKIDEIGNDKILTVIVNLILIIVILLILVMMMTNIISANDDKLRCKSASSCISCFSALLLTFSDIIFIIIMIKGSARVKLRGVPNQRGQKGSISSLKFTTCATEAAYWSKKDNFQKKHFLFPKISNLISYLRYAVIKKLRDYLGIFPKWRIVVSSPMS